jgi:hypothetical protein
MQNGGVFRLVIIIKIARNSNKDFLIEKYVTSTNSEAKTLEENGPNSNTGPNNKPKRIIRKPKRYEN